MNYVDEAKAPARNVGLVKLHTAEAFEPMRVVGEIAAECLDALTPLVQPGTTTNEIDDFCYQFGLERGAVPSPLNYRGYTKSICTSINHVVCHGIPSDKPLREGDIVNIDVTYTKDGWHGDSSRMFCVGEVSLKARRLVEVTYQAMMLGIAEIAPGKTTGDIGAAIQEYAESHRCTVVRDFCGHGIGKVFHDQPNILHYGKRGEGIELKEGMFFTVEPMINLGKPHVKVLKDGWTAVTRDKSLTAQFEHTIGVTANGVEIFTASPKGFTCPPYEA